VSLRGKGVMNRFVSGKVRFGKLMVAAIATAGFFMTVGAPAARADSITFNIDQTGGSLPLLNYGTLTLTLQVDGSIKLEVALNGGAYLIQTGQDASVAWDSSLTPDPTIGVNTISNANYSLIVAV